MPGLSYAGEGPGHEEQPTKALSSDRTAWGQATVQWFRGNKALCTALTILF